MRILRFVASATVLSVVSANESAFVAPGPNMLSQMSTWAGDLSSAVSTKLSDVYDFLNTSVVRFDGKRIIQDTQERLGAIVNGFLDNSNEMYKTKWVKNFQDAIENLKESSLFKNENVQKLLDNFKEHPGAGLAMTGAAAGGASYALYRQIAYIRRSIQYKGLVKEFDASLGLDTLPEITNKNFIVELKKVAAKVTDAQKALMDNSLSSNPLADSMLPLYSEEVIGQIKNLVVAFRMLESEDSLEAATINQIANTVTLASSSILAPFKQFLSNKVVGDKTLEKYSSFWGLRSRNQIVTEDEVDLSIPVEEEDDDEESFVDSLASTVSDEEEGDDDLSVVSSSRARSSKAPVSLKKSASSRGQASSKSNTVDVSSKLLSASSVKPEDANKKNRRLSGSAIGAIVAAVVLVLGGAAAFLYFKQK